tara:strand:- start:151 stop:552 length:402 start_codon:yes stop_codon:yes gene_type:complete
MKAYIAIKFHPDARNKKLIEGISSSLEKAGFKTYCIIRDQENWGKIEFSSQELMTKTFKEIDSSDILVIDLSEKGVGLGIEAGYAYSKRIPIITIAKKGSDISSTLKGISKKVLSYDNPEELTNIFSELKKDL